MDMKIPVIDISPLIEMNDHASAMETAKRIRQACREHGFFYIQNHGISESLQEKLEQFSKEFFSLSEKEKMEIAMQKGGSAWRGYFPVGNEFTSGKPDQKEGLYFGTELTSEHPKVTSKTPMHGGNLFPQDPKELRETVLAYMHEVTKVGHAVLRGIALSLQLPHNHFESSITKDPFILLRVFHYPKVEVQDENWGGVGEHTDYGLLTILKQDDCGGLEVRSNGEWIAAPPIANTFVCNIGDMLDLMTGGLYVSTPHRVKNTSGKNRLSFPLFFDPNFDAVVKPIPGFEKSVADHASRWDGQNAYDFKGKYGDYVVVKVSKVFPELFRGISNPDDNN
ncbi:MAG: isopenicillin N synthase family oxygenase [Flavobacteriales bacterium]|nr:isopenicillin N synthase family oxygenase [Flavobacteriales bacterium]